MSSNELSENERDQLENIFSDLKLLFTLDEILVSDIDDCLSKLKSPEAKSFINNLASGTKPETALREAFFAGSRSLLSRHLSSEMIPEVNTGEVASFGMMRRYLLHVHLFARIGKDCSYDRE